MRWVEITLEVPSPSVEPASAALTGCGCGGVAIHDPAAVSSDPFAEWVEAGDRPAAGGASLCRVCGYLPVDDRLELCLDALRASLESLRQCGIPAGDGITLRTVDEDSWADAWKAFFKPLRVGGRFVIKPSWETWREAPGELVIDIDPGMAFGSGSHPSTRLCLALVEETVRPGERVLDWGTGSGILAIGAALLGARAVAAVDLDPTAVRVAGENAARNGLQETVHVFEASIEQVAADPPFDLVVANIVADPLAAGAEEIRRRLRPGGRVIAGGIIERRAPDVTAAFAAAGLELREARAEEDWRALLAEAR